MRHKNWFRASATRGLASVFSAQAGSCAFLNLFPHSSDGDNKTYYLKVLLWKVIEIKGSKVPHPELWLFFLLPKALCR